MGPLRLVKSFSGYKVNGFKFRTMAYGSDKPSPNCGVCVKGSNYVNGESDYFGRLVEVIQIQYPGWPVKSIVLFKCEWFDPRPGVGTKINPKYPSLVEVNEKKRYSGNDIFVLATQATQVYYVNYPSLRRDKQDWLVVIKIKARAIVDIPVSNNVEPLLAHRFLKTCTDAGNVEAYYTLGMGGWVPTQGKPEIFSSMDEKKAWLMEHQYGEMNPNDKFHWKRDRRGKRFGFVHYRSRPEAARAIQNLNNSLLFGKRIRLSMARFKPRNSFWRKVKPGGHNNTMTGEGKELKKKKDSEKIESSLRDSKEEDREDDNSLKKPGKIKRVKRVVHTEDLWKAKRCLVGTMNIVCSVRSLELRLQEWGLAEINVKRLDGKSYLLAFDNDELYTMLEDVNWSYLKEIFLEIKPWSEKARFVERATWVELQGLPLHCWNHETIKKVAEQWGEFEALGENANMLLDCERVSVLITTSYEKKIEETVELEVGDEVYMVRASELRFKDVSQVKIQEIGKGEGSSDRQTKDSSSEATSANRTEEVNSQSHREEKEEALNAVVLGNSKNNDNSYDLVETNSHLGESEMKGMEGRFHHCETLDLRISHSRLH
ncbi:hypothetical protein V6N13_091773 [Hibiscus sabdariffa]